MDILQQLILIDGIGMAKAKELILAGVSSVNDLKKDKFKHLLSDETRLAINYDIETCLAWDYVDRLIKQLPNYLIGVGSYRRQKKQLGDVDLLTTKHLIEVVDDISGCDNIELIGEYAAGERKHSMVLKFEGKYVRVDIFKTTEEELPFALLHFTGSREFNIRTRAQAKRQGCKLTQYALVCDGKNIPAASEKEILDFITEYKAPKDRE